MGKGRRYNCSDVAPVSDIVSNIIDGIKSGTGSETGGIKGLRTGFERFDYKLGGIRHSSLVLLGARPYMGMAAFLRTVLLNVVLEQKKGVAYFSMEDTKETFVSRLLSTMAHVDEMRLRIADFLTDDEKKRIDDAKAAGNTFKLPFIDFSREAPFKSEAINQGLEDYNMVAFWGLDRAKIRYQVDEIRTVKLRDQIVVIKPQLLDDPSIQNLIFEEGFETIRIEEPTNEYYCRLMDKMLEGHDISGLHKEELVVKIRQKRGMDMSEESIEYVLRHCCYQYGQKIALERHLCGEDTNGIGIALTDEIFEEYNLGRHKSKDQLNSLIGIKEAKEIAVEYTALKKEGIRNPNAVIASKSLLFVGNPGTGKTTTAELIATYAAEENVGSGAYVKASRNDLIGRYVGQTAPKVEAAFDKARGGILFVDEAGFLMQRGSGSFVGEAVKEFVRFMELYKDVTVIFALYDREVEGFLAMDDGLASRIGDVVHFPDYSDDEMLQIFNLMIDKNGYKAREDVSSEIVAYIQEIRSSLQKQFGNAREMRNLADAVVKAISLRNDNEFGIEKPCEFGNVEINAAIDRLLRNKGIMKKEKAKIGFY